MPAAAGLAIAISEGESRVSEPFTIPEDIAKAVFDVATGSMNFGSGFLDNEEVDALRAFARLIGVDPMNATPSTFRDSYTHEYKPIERQYWTGKGERGYETRVVCGWCYEVGDKPVHHGTGRS